MLNDPQLHDALLGDPAKLTEPIKRVEDKYQLLPAFLKARPFMALMLRTCASGFLQACYTSKCFKFDADMLDTHS